MNGQVNGRKLPEGIIAYDIVLEGVLTVLKVSSQGEPTEASIDVSKCVRKFDGREVPLAPADSRLTASLEDSETVYRLDGQPLSPYSQEALNLAYNLGDAGRSDDAIFGTKDRKRIDDSWPINAKAAADAFRDDSEPLKPEAFIGSATLLGVKDFAGLPCIELKLEFNIRGAPTDAFDLPPGVEVRSSEIKLDGRSLYPLEVALPVVRETMTIKHKAEFVSTGPGNSSGSGTISVVRGIRREFTPLKSEHAAVTDNR
ncbi:MAG: hypothetical protein L0219_15915 [Phycisphaerales bacterium]|nr:hypothetical protein [Phycisphaerales bacterium]